MAFFPCNNGQYDEFDVFNVYYTYGAYAMNYDHGTITGSLYTSTDATTKYITTNEYRQVLAKTKCHVIGYRFSNSGYEYFDADYQPNQVITQYSASVGYVITLYAFPI